MVDLQEGKKGRGDVTWTGNGSLKETTQLSITTIANFYFLSLPFFLFLFDKTLIWLRTKMVTKSMRAIQFSAPLPFFFAPMP